MVAGGLVWAYRETDIKYFIGGNSYVLTDEGEKYYILKDDSSLCDVHEAEYKLVSEVLQEEGGKIVTK